MKQIKTNAMRMLEQKNIDYTVHTYESNGEALDGITVSSLIDKPSEQVFKTLVTQGHSGQYYVAVIPVGSSLDLKKLTHVVQEKNVSLIHVKDINIVTGYVRGGCSPIGMKKQFPTILHESCILFDTIIFSAGKIGVQIEVPIADILGLDFIQMADVCMES